jgi:hypothetical protein
LQAASTASASTMRGQREASEAMRAMMAWFMTDPWAHRLAAPKALAAALAAYDSGAVMLR